MFNRLIAGCSSLVFVFLTLSLGLYLKAKYEEG